MATFGGLCSKGGSNLCEIDPQFHAGAGVVPLKLNQNVLNYKYKFALTL